ncbi:MAG: cytochrome-c oxidase, cbb3-type subunit III [Pseudomonadota bacterium]
MADQNEKDPKEEFGTTGHTWDGIEELNTPLPKWWLYTFYVTCVWGIIYTILYPAWPLVNSATEGVLGWSTRENVAVAIAEHEEKNAPLADALNAVELAALEPGGDLHRYATQRGAAVFGAHCSQCHGSGAQGAVGYPNLLDDAWLWGGDIDNIFYTVNHGIRNDTDFDARYSEMPVFGEDYLSDEEIASVVEYVLSISNQEHDAAMLSLGSTIFAENCTSCHGENGMGMTELGSPNLTDAIWLYGGDRESLVETITYSRFGVMPAWGQRLPEADIRAVSVYVHALGGGE